MKRRDFIIRSGAGVLVGLFAGAKGLAAVRPTSGRSMVFRDATLCLDGEVIGMDMASGPDETAWVTVQDSRPFCDPSSGRMPPHHDMCRCVVLQPPAPGELIGRHMYFSDGSVRLIVGYDGNGPILEPGAPPSPNDTFVIV